MERHTGHCPRKVIFRKKESELRILEVMQKYTRQNYPWLADKNIIFEGASYS